MQSCTLSPVQFNRCCTAIAFRHLSQYIHLSNIKSHVAAEVDLQRAANAPNIKSACSPEYSHGNCAGTVLIDI